jgi:excisionase family DNA binding protein
MAAPELPMLLRIPEVARALGIARSLAYEMARDGRLPAIHIGKAVRVPRRQLEAWIAEKTDGGPLAPPAVGRHP